MHALVYLLPARARSRGTGRWPRLALLLRECRLPLGRSLLGTRLARWVHANHIAIISSLHRHVVCRSLMFRLVDRTRLALSAHNLPVPRRLFGKVWELVVRDAVLRKRRSVLVNDVLHPTPVVPSLEPGVLGVGVDSGDLSAQWPNMDDVLRRDLVTSPVDGVNHVLTRVRRG